MTDAELIQRAQESEYEVATQRTTIENLVVENEKMTEREESLLDTIDNLKADNSNLLAIMGEVHVALQLAVDSLEKVDRRIVRLERALTFIAAAYVIVGVLFAIFAR